ncbi:unnamed protein product [Didymodactylos carnosus]|uniref:Uncharacterized protein n=1 Tax=Didymodactylos carnosus TaxID=1234261 RepID=A0A815ESB6_9BILA|nr:unnamed protein product [Didymodactylos carnosus]CAF1347660.1 unnamed protein product [Didymodactylos carnosus]CAF4158274.1 unnamed protein product [Didymodactylos carnosus]CAF4158606.1 unnamed protein product [Didymodactylos carnosus]
MKRFTPLSRLSSSNYFIGIELNGYTFIHRLREECFENAHPLRSLAHGGAGIYIKEGIPFEQVILMDVLNVECVFVHLPLIGLFIVTAYRPAKQSKTDFSNRMKEVRQIIDSSNKTVFLCDINENSLSDAESHIIDESFIGAKFTNLFHKVPTTNELSSIDRIYVNFGTEDVIERIIIPNYYSYHEGFGISIKNCVMLQTDSQIKSINSNVAEVPGMISDSLNITADKNSSSIMPTTLFDKCKFENPISDKKVSPKQNPHINVNEKRHSPYGKYGMTKYDATHWYTDDHIQNIIKYAINENQLLNENMFNSMLCTNRFVQTENRMSNDIE